MDTPENKAKEGIPDAEGGSVKKGKSRSADAKGGDVKKGKSRSADAKGGSKDKGADTNDASEQLVSAENVKRRLFSPDKHFFILDDCLYHHHLKKDELSDLKKEHKVEKVRPFKKLSQFIDKDNDVVLVPESWIKKFDYDWDKFHSCYENEILDFNSVGVYTIKIKKDKRGKIIDPKTELFKFSKSSTWEIDGFEPDNVYGAKDAPGSPSGVDEIDVLDDMEMNIQENAGDEKIEEDAIAVINKKEEEQKVSEAEAEAKAGEAEAESKAKSEEADESKAKSEEAGESKAKSEEAGESKAKAEETGESKAGESKTVVTYKQHLHHITVSLKKCCRQTYNLDSLHTQLMDIIHYNNHDDIIGSTKLPKISDSFNSILECLALIHVELTGPDPYKRLAETFMRFLVKIQEKYDKKLDITIYPYVKKSKTIKKDITMQHVFSKYEEIDVMQDRAMKIKNEYNDKIDKIATNKRFESKDCVKDSKKTNIEYLKSRTWLKFIVDMLEDYIYDEKKGNMNKIPLEEIDIMFHMNSPKSLYSIIHDAENKMREIEFGKREYDTSSRQYGKGGTRQTFMNTVMDIEKCFKFESREYMDFSYDDAYYYANKLGEWCFYVLNKFDIRIGTSTFGILAGKIPSYSIWKTKEITDDDNDVTYADTFGLFLSHLKRDFFEEKDEYHYKNHYGDNRKVETNKKSLIQEVNKIDKHFFNFNIESWLNMFERGLKEGVTLRFIEEQVEKIIKRKISTEYYEDAVESEMEFMEYRIWVLLNQFVYPHTGASHDTIWNKGVLMEKKNAYLQKENVSNDKTDYDSKMKLIHVFEDVLKKHTHFCYKNEKERLVNRMKGYQKYYDDVKGSMGQTDGFGFTEQWLCDYFLETIEKDILKLEEDVRVIDAEMQDILNQGSQKRISLVIAEEQGCEDIVKNNLEKQINDLDGKSKELDAERDTKKTVLGAKREILKNYKEIEEVMIMMKDDKRLKSIIMKTDEHFIIKDSEIIEHIILLMFDGKFDNKLLREEIFPGIICGFLDIYSTEIYLKCDTYKKKQVAKFIGRRLDTPEKVYDMYYNWNDKEELMCDIMCILWFMDDHVDSMAKCIQYFDERKEPMGILKEIWLKWVEQFSLSYSNLHTKLIPIISQDRLKDIRKLFSITKENEIELKPGDSRNKIEDATLLVYSGEYKLCVVKLLSKIVSSKDKVYWACEILSQPGDKNFNIELPVNIEETCFDDPTIKIGGGGGSTFDELKEFSDLHHVRLGSWNVACMNGPDIPKTVSEYEEKFNNLTRIIFRSGCNIIALQELPNELKIVDDTGKGPDKHYKFHMENKELSIKYTITSKLEGLTGSTWDIRYSQVNHTLDSFSHGEKLDARKNRKEIYAFVYNTSVVRYLHPDQNKTNKVEDRRTLNDRFARCPIISNFCANKLEFTLLTVHLPPTDKKTKTFNEIKDLGSKVFPELIATYGEKKSKSVIFLGDFNMGYIQKKKLNPRPSVDTWDSFYNAGYVPCIKTATNVLQNMHYDNIWMHHSMESLMITKAGESNTGVIKVNEIEGTPFVIGSSLAEGFKKRVSDHNLVYVDLRSNEVMPWSSSNVVLKREN